LGKEEVEKELEIRDGIFALQLLAYRDEWELTGHDIEYAIRRIARATRHLEKGELRALVEWYLAHARSETGRKALITMKKAMSDPSNENIRKCADEIFRILEDSGYFSGIETEYTRQRVRESIENNLRQIARRGGKTADVEIPPIDVM